MAFHIFLVSLFLLNALRTFDTLQADSDPDVRWETFKKTYGKTYKAEEEEMRRKTFEKNFRKISEHNQRYEQGLHSFHLGFNEFADMVLEEFAKMVNGYISSETEAPIPFVVPSNFNAPDSVDWRNQGAVTEVKNQGQCGSCYSFSATGALEGQHKLRRGKLVSLSEQNIIDCSHREGNDGCDGGDMDASFQYVMLNGGLDSEKSYPYKAKVGKCNYKRKNSETMCLGYSDVTPRDEDTLKIAVAMVGPISVAIDASHDSFQLYQGGIYNEPNCSSTYLDHGVLAVGYGSEDGNDYWLVKNSWGTGWGENGYIKMSRNKNNQCGIATEASFPVL
ncbi:procathepsin L-like [Argiope bruennichi]|uniref:Cathepsin L1 like protein n=1 Tax=Argiope bruennichi TaxID=94029 RepID=A0A8T0FQ67_ARGBR|nr:procathepsin L-like [Argiope bruennichi]KAF8793251.1 Cathepsin L1 like protein [Argiope bruennichi]